MDLMDVSKAVRTSFYLQSYFNLKFYLKNAETLIVLELLTTENLWNFVS